MGPQLEDLLTKKLHSIQLREKTCYGAGCLDHLAMELCKGRAWSVNLSVSLVAPEPHSLHASGCASTQVTAGALFLIIFFSGNVRFIRKGKKTFSASSSSSIHFFLFF